jgi:hypothetical protein
MDDEIELKTFSVQGKKNGSTLFHLLLLSMKKYGLISFQTAGMHGEYGTASYNTGMSDKCHARLCDSTTRISLLPNILLKNVLSHLMVCFKYVMLVGQAVLA